jgi:hypothetical protein
MAVEVAQDQDPNFQEQLSDNFFDSWFCLEPPLQSQQTGDPVCFGNSVIACNQRWKRYLHARNDGKAKEMSASFHQSTRLVLVPFSRLHGMGIPHSVAMQRSAQMQQHQQYQQVLPLCGGDWLRLFHVESQSFLANDLIPKKVTQSGGAEGIASKDKPHQPETNKGLETSPAGAGSAVVSPPPPPPILVDFLQKTPICWNCGQRCVTL